MHIEVYGRPMCDACEVAINILEQNGAPYRYFNIEELSSDEILYLMNEKAPGATQVPIIFIDNRRIYGIHGLLQFFENAEATSRRVDIDNVHEEGRYNSNLGRNGQLRSNP